MFTGIIETTGTIWKRIENGSNTSFWIKSPISSKLKADQSVSHDGICLTVEEVKKNRHRVTAVAETQNKSTSGEWQPGKPVNLERCLRLNDRLDGHFVQGHVDTIATCINRTDKNGSYEFRFEFDPAFKELIIEKGSISINGISLTAFNVTGSSFDVAIIPYTFDHTNLNILKEGDSVNIEFDMLGKYISRKLSLEK